MNRGLIILLAFFFTAQSHAQKIKYFEDLHEIKAPISSQHQLKLDDATSEKILGLLPNSSNTYSIELYSRTPQGIKTTIEITNLFEDTGDVVEILLTKEDVGESAFSAINKFVTSTINEGAFSHELVVTDKGLFIRACSLESIEKLN